MFLNCSTCFERHTAHHQELKNCNCGLWFYLRFWLPAAVMVEFPFSHDSCQQSQTYVKPEAAISVFELLMMSGVSLETCWAIKKHWNNKFYYTVASCWLFLYDSLLWYTSKIEIWVLGFVYFIHFLLKFLTSLLTHEKACRSYQYGTVNRMILVWSLYLTNRVMYLRQLFEVFLHNLSSTPKD